MSNMIPIRLGTKYGTEEFNVLRNQFNHYTKEGLREEFKARCKEDLLVETAYLEAFLDDDTLAKKYKMNDDDWDGLMLYNIHVDLYSSLKYFSEKAY